MSHYVIDGTLVFQPGKIRLNLYLLHWEHIVLLTTGSPGKFLLLFFNFWVFFALPCWFSTSSLIKLWPYMSNQFLDQTSTLYECFINKLQQGERDLYIQHTTLLPPNYEYPQHKTRLFLQSRWNVEGGKQREDWELDHHDASVPPKCCWVHLLVSAVPSAHLKSISTTQARWGVFLSQKTEETLHSLQPSGCQPGTGFPEDILLTMSGHIFGCHNWGIGDYCIQWIEVGDAVTHPAMYRSPHQQRLVWSKCQPC